MNLFPAIDLYDKKVVRLKMGDYSQMTVYGDNPAETACMFYKCGARYLHVVDLEGAKYGNTPNIDVIKDIIKCSSMNVEVGGGIRNEETVEKYLDAGVFRVILGTAAVENPQFLKKMIDKYGSEIAVGVDIKDGTVATHGWIKNSDKDCFSFCAELEKMGVSAIIVTDISKDGLLSGTNLNLYRDLSEKFSMDIIASGGVSSLNDVIKLNEVGVSGAILGRALYTGDIDLKAAISEVK